VLFDEDDYTLHRDLPASQCRKHGVAVFLPVCVTPNPTTFISFSSPTARRSSALGRATPERLLFCVLRLYRDRPGTRASGRLDPFAAPSSNDCSLRMLLKNSQIEQLRKSRSGAHRVV
jgi:hypothetical protein